MFVDSPTLSNAVANLYGSAGHLLKIWLTLKHMGLSETSGPVEIDTSNSTPSLQRLFSCGAPDGRFYIPFAHTPRYLTIKHDAARSIVQTTIQRWATSGSVVTCDPTEFLEIKSGEGSKLQVSLGRRYPFGLGIGESGFALQDGARVSVPIRSFAVWYGRQSEIPVGEQASTFLVAEMIRELNISQTEQSLIFVDDDLAVGVQISKLTDKKIFSICTPYIEGESEPNVEISLETFPSYERRVRSMVSGLDLPVWMRASPEDDVRELLAAGARAILLFGPPRTGKTRLVDALHKRDSKSRCTIQIHDGWGYDNLIEGFKPDSGGKWEWTDGPLKAAIDGGKKFIVLEEINRTAISQALGEVFSLIEDSYRGKSNAIELRSGRKFWIPEDVIFLMTMNTVDKSTEDIDDALLGRVAAVELPPRLDDLDKMLASNGVPAATRGKLAQLFATIIAVYPLGHGYFAGLSGAVSDADVVRHYKTRVRPVLLNFLGALKFQDLANIDNVVDATFTGK